MQTLMAVFLISIVPISLIKFKIIPAKFRLFILFLVFVWVSFALYFQGTPIKELGIRLDNLYPAIIFYTGATAGVILFFTILSKILKNKVAKKWHNGLTPVLGKAKVPLFAHPAG